MKGITLLVVVSWCLGAVGVGFSEYFEGLSIPVSGVLLVVYFLLWVRSNENN